MTTEFLSFHCERSKGHSLEDLKRAGLLLVLAGSTLALQQHRGHHRECSSFDNLVLGRWIGKFTAEHFFNL